MQRSLAKSVSILGLLLAIPVLCLAWAYEPSAVSKDSEGKLKLGDSIRNNGGGPFQSGPATAINVPAPTRKAPPVSKRLYPPNVQRTPKASQAAEAGLTSIFSFLLPTKDDLDKCFKAEDDGRGRSTSDPFRKRGRH